MSSFSALIALTALVAPAGENLLDNGGFERELRGWTLINNSGRSEAEIDNKERKEGRRSLRWQRTGGPPFDVLRADLGELTPGATLRISGWFKTEGVGNCILKVFFYDAQGDSLGQGSDMRQIRGDGPWSEHAIDNAVPDGQKTATVFVLMTGGGTLWIDEMSASTEDAPRRGESTQGEKDDAPRRPLDRALKVWLDRNAVKVRDLEFDGSLSDLRPLKKLLRDVRVVQLGEQSHGDGATFAAKARLVRFLHEEMGFDLLAFESGLYECEVANESLAAGDADAAKRDSVFGIWRVVETAPMFEYLADRAKTRDPLRLTGFDIRASGAAAARMFDQVAAFAEPAFTVTPEDKAALDAMESALGEDRYDPEKSVRDAGLAALDRIGESWRTHRDALVAKHGAREVALLERCLRNYRHREAFERSKTTGDTGDAGSSVNLRDEHMASNLRWLLEERYPESKVICWAATFHQAHDLHEVSIRGNDDYYKDTKGMGEYVHEWLGDQVYTIAFAAHHGEAGIGGPRFTLETPRDDSIEDLLHRYGAPYLFVDLRGKSPFSKEMYCSPMSYDRTIRARWPKVLDAILFTDEQFPSHW